MEKKNLVLLKGYESNQLEKTKMEFIAELNYCFGNSEFQYAIDANPTSTNCICICKVDNMTIELRHAKNNQVLLSCVESIGKMDASFPILLKNLSLINWKISLEQAAYSLSYESYIINDSEVFEKEIQQFFSDLSYDYFIRTTALKCVKHRENLNRSYEQNCSTEECKFLKRELQYNKEAQRDLFSFIYERELGDIGSYFIVYDYPLSEDGRAIPKAKYAFCKTFSHDRKVCNYLIIRINYFNNMDGMCVYIIDEHVSKDLNQCENTFPFDFDYTEALEHMLGRGGKIDEHISKDLHQSENTFPFDFDYTEALEHMLGRGGKIDEHISKDLRQSENTFPFDFDYTETLEHMLGRGGIE